MFKLDKQPKSIDFLQPVYSPTDIWSTSYIWLTTVGKYLLIAVEVVVLAVFFSRFIYDKKNNDLTEDVNAKVTLLSNNTWKQNAILYENYQNLLTDVRKVRVGQEISSTKISELISGVPSSIQLMSFSYSANRVSLRLTASSLDAVKNYESALKNNPDYYDVTFSITKEKNDINVSVSFYLTAVEK